MPSAPRRRAPVSGDELWRRVYNGPGDGKDAPCALAVAPGGTAIYVAGNVTPSGGLQSDVAVVKRKARGTRVWTRTCRVSSGRQAAFAPLVAGNRSVWVAGHVDTATRREWVAARYTAAGTREWLTRWSGPPGDPRGGSAHGCLTFGTYGLFVAGAVGTAADGDDAAAVWFRR